MSIVIPPGYYLHSPASRMIMLFDPYNTISLEQIRSIRNLPKQIKIYDSKDPRRHRCLLTGNEQIGTDINVSDGIISYVETAKMDSSDEIQIILSDNTSNPKTGISSSLIECGNSASTALFTLDGGDSTFRSLFEIDGGFS